MANITVYEIRTDCVEFRLPARAKAQQGGVEQFLNEHIDPSAGFAGEDLHIVEEYPDKASALERLQRYRADIWARSNHAGQTLIRVASYWAVEVNYELDEAGERDYSEDGDPLAFAPFADASQLRIAESVYDWDEASERWLESSD